MVMKCEAQVWRLQHATTTALGKPLSAESSSRSKAWPRHPLVVSRGTGSSERQEGLWRFLGSQPNLGVAWERKDCRAGPVARGRHGRAGQG
jgi:hypothetical protein